MGLVKIDLDLIQSGTLMEYINEALDTISEDVIYRHGVAEAREVNIKIKITPNRDPETRLNIPEIDWSVSHKVPGRKGMTTRAFVDAENRRLMINTGDPLGTNPEQTNIFDEEMKEGE